MIRAKKGLKIDRRLKSNGDKFDVASSVTVSSRQSCSTEGPGRRVFRERKVAQPGQNRSARPKRRSNFSQSLWLLAIHPVKCTRKHRARIARIIIRARNDGSAPPPLPPLINIPHHEYSRHQMRFTPITPRAFSFYLATFKIPTRYDRYTNYTTPIRFETIDSTTDRHREIF